MQLNAFMTLCFHYFIGVVSCQWRHVKEKQQKKIKHKKYYKETATEFSLSASKQNGNETKAYFFFRLKNDKAYVPKK